LGTNEPLYVHRRGSNVFNGEYFCDKNPRKTVGHYSSFRKIDMGALRLAYLEAAAASSSALAEASPLSGGGSGLPKFYCVGNDDFGSFEENSDASLSLPRRAAQLVMGLNERGYWPMLIPYTSHRFVRDGSAEIETGDFSETHVGDPTDTSPFPDPRPSMGIATGVYVRNMSILIEYLDSMK
jgi:hypothetical protein